VGGGAAGEADEAALEALLGAGFGDAVCAAMDLAATRHFAADATAEDREVALEAVFDLLGVVENVMEIRPGLAQYALGIAVEGHPPPGTAMVGTLLDLVLGLPAGASATRFAAELVAVVVQNLPPLETPGEVARRVAELVAAPLFEALAAHRVARKEEESEEDLETPENMLAALCSMLLHPAAAAELMERDAAEEVSMAELLVLLVRDRPPLRESALRALEFWLSATASATPLLPLVAKMGAMPGALGVVLTVLREKKHSARGAQILATMLRGYLLLAEEGDKKLGDPGFVALAKKLARPDRLKILRKLLDSEEETEQRAASTCLAAVAVVDKTVGSEKISDVVSDIKPVLLKWHVDLLDDNDNEEADKAASPEEIEASTKAKQADASILKMLFSTLEEK